MPMESYAAIYLLSSKECDRAKSSNLLPLLVHIQLQNYEPISSGTGKVGGLTISKDVRLGKGVAHPVPLFGETLRMTLAPTQHNYVITDI